MTALERGRIFMLLSLHSIDEENIETSVREVVSVRLFVYSVSETVERILMKICIWFLQ